MAEVDVAPQFGAELKDAFKPVNNWVSNGIAWLEDIEQFYRERSAIEKEYSQRLCALAKKYHEKKAKKSINLSVGDTPIVTPGSLESASMTTWTTQLTALEFVAAEHDRHSSDLINNIAAPLKAVAGRYEELRKSHADYADKLEKERDTSYADLKKMKGKYDNVCQEVEGKRKKIDSSYDNSKPKAQHSYQKQIHEMNNVKNTYIISINITNKLKEKYYHEYIPEVLDSLQNLNETRVAKLNSLWLLATDLESQVLDRCKEHITRLEGEIPRNEPSLDSVMFMQHNISDWKDPADFVFEPSPIWHDDSSMATDETAKIFLRNILMKAKGDLGELQKESDGKRREIESARRIRRNIQEGRERKDEVEVVRAIFNMQGGLHEVNRKLLTAQVEKSTIIAAAGDLSIGARNHDFKQQTFKMPTNCDLCGERIWGLSAKGFDCRDCGYTCHSKCQMKVPADCPGEQSKEEKKKLKAERQEAASAARHHNGSATESTSDLPALSRSNTMNSLSSGYAASARRSVSAVARPPSNEKIPEYEDSTKPATPMKPITFRKNRLVAPPPAQYISSTSSIDDTISTNHSSHKTEPRGKMLYPYNATGEGEISVSEGKEVAIVEPDDGSGWTRVKCGVLEGLVPTSYVEISISPAPTSSSSPTSPRSPQRRLSTYSTSSISMAGSMTSGKKKGPAVAPKRGAKKLKYAEALYNYEARTDLEWSMKEGDRFVLVNKNAGDGWADVERGGLVKSVPANYIQEV